MCHSSWRANGHHLTLVVQQEGACLLPVTFALEVDGHLIASTLQHQSGSQDGLIGQQGGPRGPHIIQSHSVPRQQVNL